MGIASTPGFFINGIFLSGAQPEPAFEKVIDDKLKAVGGAPGCASVTVSSSSAEPSQ